MCQLQRFVSFAKTESDDVSDKMFGAVECRTGNRCNSNICCQPPRTKRYGICEWEKLSLVLFIFKELWNVPTNIPIFEVEIETSDRFFFITSFISTQRNLSDINQNKE
jgi:hypothetical protein